MTVKYYPNKLVYAVATFQPSTSKDAWLSVYCLAEDTLQRVTQCLHGRFAVIDEGQDEASHRQLHSGETYQLASKFLMEHPGPAFMHKHYSLGPDDDDDNFEAALVLLATLTT